jgi:hypothetical protein
MMRKLARIETNLMDSGGIQDFVREIAEKVGTEVIVTTDRAVAEEVSARMQTGEDIVCALVTFEGEVDMDDDYPLRCVYCASRVQIGGEGRVARRVGYTMNCPSCNKWLRIGHDKDKSGPYQYFLREVESEH